jgi:hypothetical protein
LGQSAPVRFGLPSIIAKGGKVCGSQERMVETVWTADTQLQLSQRSYLDTDLNKGQQGQSPSSSVSAADSKGKARLGSKLGSQTQPVEISSSDESSVARRAHSGHKICTKKGMHLA